MASPRASPIYTNSAISVILGAEFPEDLLVGLSLGLGHEEDDMQSAEHAARAKDPEGGVVLHGLDQVGVEKSDDETQRPIDGGTQGARRSTHLRRKNLSADDPNHGTGAEREEDDVQNQGRQRQPPLVLKVLLYNTCLQRS